MSSFVHDHSTTRFHSQDISRERNGGRPNFSSSKTSDRLRESDRRPSIPRITTKPRRSVFREEWLDDVNCSVHSPIGIDKRKCSIPTIELEETRGRNVTFDDILMDIEDKEHKVSESMRQKKGHAPWFSKMARPKIKTTASAPPGSFSSLTRVTLLVFLIAVVVPGFKYSGGREKVFGGADAGVMLKGRKELVENGSVIEGRQNSPTDVCTRWSHMSRFLLIL